MPFDDLDRVQERLGVADGVEEPPRVIADPLVFRRGEPHDRCARRVGALAEEWDCLVDLILTSALEDPLVRVAEHRVVPRYAFL